MLDLRIPTEVQCATLVLSVAGIVPLLIDSDGVDWDNDITVPPPLSLADTENLLSRHGSNANDLEAVLRPRTSMAW